MKSLFSWKYPNFNASNISGLSVLAAGMHYPEIEMSNTSDRLGDQAFFWSSTYNSTASGIDMIWVIMFDRQYNSITRAPYFREDQGNSVRCIKN